MRHFRMDRQICAYNCSELVLSSYMHTLQDVGKNRKVRE